ncbi:transposase family protein, partial [Bifidobacterium longum]|uniref:transposase family protein n=1 Tax=Bifidobacterium longum TaxID=216816 RepID=UPI001F595F6A
MDTTSLFTAALQLPDPWRVSGVEFCDEEDGRRELHIAIGFAAGSRFPCPEPGCGEAACPVHDARERVWRHLNFFQYKAFICISSSRCFVFSHVFFSGLGSCMH